MRGTCRNRLHTIRSQTDHGVPRNIQNLRGEVFFPCTVQLAYRPKIGQIRHKGLFGPRDRWIHEIRGPKSSMKPKENKWETAPPPPLHRVFLAKDLEKRAKTYKIWSVGKSQKKTGRCASLFFLLFLFFASLCVFLLLLFLFGGICA